MPTVLRIDGLRVVTYLNDHSPVHLHVIGAEREAVFELHCPTGPVTLRECFGYTVQELLRMMDGLNVTLQELCSAWRSIHGSE